MATGEPISQTAMYDGRFGNAVNVATVINVVYRTAARQRKIGVFESLRFFEKATAVFFAGEKDEPSSAVQQAKFQPAGDALALLEKGDWAVAAENRGVRLRRRGEDLQLTLAGEAVLLAVEGRGDLRIARLPLLTIAERDDAEAAKRKRQWGLDGLLVVPRIRLELSALADRACAERQVDKQYSHDDVATTSHGEPNPRTQKRDSRKTSGGVY
jgi:hypothetical protein